MEEDSEVVEEAEAASNPFIKGRKSFFCDFLLQLFTNFLNFVIMNMVIKMYMRIHNNLREVVIQRKRTTKNTYMRVKEDGKVYVTTNPFMSDKKIATLLEEHVKEITKMADFIEQKREYQEKFFYLGKEYDIVFTNDKEVRLGDSKVFLGKNADLSKWYKKQAEVLFKEHLDEWYHRFNYRIPYPSLRIRSMKSRWGVCNTRDKIITLNLELMKRKIECLDYVIVHELSHLVEANHSTKFWKVVEENYPDYKEIKKQMKEYK